MKIGLDFDNTIVSYDELFFDLACERDLIPADIAASKTAIRDYLRRVGQEPSWTALQGLAYGQEIGRARMFSGVLAFVHACHQAGVPLAIVSHKTRNPYRGSDTDLHAAARAWLDHNGLGSEAAFFELTKEAKLARIAALELTHFVDDLPEFLSLPGFPPHTRKLLFDPLGLHVPAADVLRVASWSEVTTVLLCTTMAA
jgi:hypothetical protein